MCASTFLDIKGDSLGSGLVLGAGDLLGVHFGITDFSASTLRYTSA